MLFTTILPVFLLSSPLQTDDEYAHRFELETVNTTTQRSQCSETFLSLSVTRNLTAKCLVVRCSATILGNLCVRGNARVNGNLTVNGTIINPTVIVNGCQPGPLIVGTSNATSFTLTTNNCTNRLSIDPNGAITIAMPSAGQALTVNGNVVLPSVNAAATQGSLDLGGTNSTTNVSIYESGTRNLFVGNGTVNAAVTGTDNISIGSSANSSLTSASNTIALGTAAQATGTNSIAVGDGANTTFSGAIVVGSKDSTSSGAAPTAGNTNAIVIGSADGTQAGASATGASAIAIGGSDGSFPGAVTSGSHSIALGVNASCSSDETIAIGSAGQLGGLGPRANATGAIAIGSGANTGLAGAGVRGVYSIGIGSSDTVFSGPNISGDHAIGIGVNATSAQPRVIVIGSASGVAGGSGPSVAAANGIAIGSANGVLIGASVGASGLSAIAIGGSDGEAPGAVASGSRSIALGVNATASGTSSIAIGSAPGTGGVASAVASNTTGIAIGSAFSNQPGASASGMASVAIGASDGTNPGASATGTRSVALGTGAISGQTDAIILGNAANAGVMVGIGTSAPIAKLDVRNPNATTSALNVVGITGAPAAVITGGGAATDTPLQLINLQSNAGGAGFQNVIYNTNAGVTNSFLFYQMSSRKGKTNIESIDQESSFIYKLNPVTFDAKPGYGTGKHIAGFIAEEVYEVAPHVVGIREDGSMTGIDYNALHAYTIKEVQKHQQLFDEQNRMIEEQNAAINKLLHFFEDALEIGKKKSSCLNYYDAVKVLTTLAAHCLTVNNKAVIKGNLTVGGDMVVDNNFTISGTVSNPSIITSNCEPGPLMLGTQNATSLTLTTNNCTNRLSIDPNGAVTIAMPSVGQALTVNGNVVVPSANAAATQGLLDLGGTNTTTNVAIYESGTRNLFAGNGTVNAAVTGTDNVSIGSSANHTLTTANNTIALGTAVQATATDDIAMGNSATTTFTRAIVIGSASAGGGAAPVANVPNSIVIGSANGGVAGPSATGAGTLGQIMIGGADGVFAGPSSISGRTIALGVHATCNGVASIAIGSASGVAGGTAPTASANSIAIGSAQSNPVSVAGPVSQADALAIGSADGVFPGATAGSRSVSIGVNAHTTQVRSIVIGSSSGSVGGFGPTTSSFNTIAIGSAQNGFAGPSAGSFACIAIGGSDGTTPGATASGSLGRSIAVGVNANASGGFGIGIALGSTSGVAGGTAPAASNTTSVAIGSANGTQPGATSSNTASLALGGSDGVSPGASATNLRSVALGTSAVNAGAETLILGNTANTNVMVGIGTATPSVKLDVRNPNVATSALNVIGVTGAPAVVITGGGASTDTPLQLINLQANAGGAGFQNVIYDTNADATNSFLFYLTSSRKAKTNIESIDQESSFIYKLNPVTFDAKPGYGTGKHIAGFIAEEVYDSAPYLVGVREDGSMTGIDYNALHAYTIKEVQNHQQLLDERRIFLYQRFLLIKQLVHLIEQAQGPL